MRQFDDYPYSQFREALDSVLGRVLLVVAAALAGSMLGGFTATQAFDGLWLGLIQSPSLGLASMFFGIGIVVLPAIALYAFVSIRYEWPLRLTLICVGLMWLNIHKTIRWIGYDGPLVNQQQKLRAE